MEPPACPSRACHSPNSPSQLRTPRPTLPYPIFSRRYAARALGVGAVRSDALSMSCELCAQGRGLCSGVKGSARPRSQGVCATSCGCSSPAQVRWSLQVVGTEGSLEVSRGGWGGARTHYTLRVASPEAVAAAAASGGAAGDGSQTIQVRAGLGATRTCWPVRLVQPARAPASESPSGWLLLPTCGVAGALQRLRRRVRGLPAARGGARRRYAGRRPPRQPRGGRAGPGAGGGAAGVRGGGRRAGAGGARVAGAAEQRAAARSVGGRGAGKEAVIGERWPSDWGAVRPRRGRGARRTCGLQAAGTSLSHKERSRPQSVRHSAHVSTCLPPCSTPGVW
jgi:hypothetical protein